jgi:drug/metabolite transporter (DMT)-like permease
MGRVDWRVHAALLFVQITFGAFPVVGKAVLVHLSPLAVAGLRVLVAAPVLLALAWRLERVRFPRGHLKELALLGFLGVFANQVLFIVGLARTTATNAAILMPSIPVFTVLVAAVLGVERLSKHRALGVGLAVVGALVLLDPTSFSLAGGTSLGDVLILLNCLAYAAYLVLQRPLLQRLPALTLIAWAFVLGGVGVLAVAVPSLAAAPLAVVPAAAWVGTAYIVLIPTALNYALNTWAIRRSSAALAATYTTLQPVVAALLGTAFLAERVGVRQLAGFTLIVGGLAILGGPGQRRGRQ